MKARSDSVGDAPAIRAYCSVGALAKVAGVHTSLLRRRLIAAGAQLVRDGRTAIVPLDEIKRRLRAMWACLVAQEAARGGAEQGEVVRGEAKVAKRAARVSRERLS